MGTLIDIKTNLTDCRYSDGAVLVDGKELECVKMVEIQLVVGCMPTARVELTAAQLDLQNVDGIFYTLLGNRQYRLEEVGVDHSDSPIIQRIDDQGN